MKSPSTVTTAPITLADLPGSLPPDTIPPDTDLDLSNLSHVALDLLRHLTERNLVHDVSWKDWLALTGQVRTWNGARTVARVWAKAVARNAASEFEISDARVNRTGLGTGWVDVTYRFGVRTQGGLRGVCSGSLGIVFDGGTGANTSMNGGEEGKWKIWFVTSVLERFEGLGDPDVPVMERGYAGGMDDSDSGEFQVVLVGGGQSGLSHAGRLQALGIKYVLLERLDKVGRSWTTKYDTVKQHALKEYNNLPFGRTWNADDDDLLSASRVTEGFQMWATKHNLNIWTSVDLSSCSWDPEQRKWTLHVTRNDGSDTTRTITCRHLALGIGGGVSEPNRPRFSGESEFKGDFLLASDFKNSKTWKGKHGIVIGTGTSAHDIAQDMLDNALSSVTMIQRTKTAVYPIDWLVKGQKVLYNLYTPTAHADRTHQTLPFHISGSLMSRSLSSYYTSQPDARAILTALQKANFKTDTEANMLDQILRGWGGYYIDVGTSRHIVDGRIKVKSSVTVSRFVEDGVVFRNEDEEEMTVKADVVVLAVGYQHDYRRQVAGLVGEEVADGLDEFWGWTRDGDVRGVMREAAPGLWLLAGTCAQARFWSRFVALKMQAEFLGKPLVELNDGPDDFEFNGANGVNGVNGSL